MLATSVQASQEADGMDVQKQEREQRAPGTRERILQVAEQLIATHGVEGLELKEVAARVGIRPPSIFGHFGGRDDLCEAVAQRFADRVLEQYVMDPKGDPVHVLKQSVRNLVKYFAENPAQVRVVMRDMSAPGGSQFRSASRMRDQITSRVGALIRCGTQTGVFRPVRVDGFVWQLTGAMLANMAMVGWDEQGRLNSSVPLETLQAETEDLALRMLQRDDRPLTSETANGSEIDA